MGKKLRGKNCVVEKIQSQNGVIFFSKAVTKMVLVKLDINILDIYHTCKYSLIILRVYSVMF